ncbi:MAG: hypothetical protein U0821_11650 [Chloroflexota bacterium]
MSELDLLRARDDVLQALFWMRGEGLGSWVHAAEVARVVGIDEPTVAVVLDHLVSDGLASIRQGTAPGAMVVFGLTDGGVREGGRRFADEFAGLTRQAHGECGPGCWCQDPRHAGEPCPSTELTHAHA